MGSPGPDQGLQEPAAGQLVTAPWESASRADPCSPVVVETDHDHGSSPSVVDVDVVDVAAAAVVVAVVVVAAAVSAVS